MSDGRTLERILSRDRDSEADQLVESHPCFGWLRGARAKAPMLELRKKSGAILAIGYPWLERAEFDPLVGITLSFVGRTVKLTGRVLNGGENSQIRLFEGIARHRVSWIREADRADQIEATSCTAIVDSIDW